MVKGKATPQIMEDKLICPKCHEADQTEFVTAILERTFPTTAQPGTEPFRWAGKTYYMQKKALKDFSTKSFKTKTIWSASPQAYYLMPKPTDRLLNAVMPPIKPPNFFSEISQIFIVWVLSCSVVVSITLLTKKGILAVLGIITTIPIFLNLYNEYRSREGMYKYYKFLSSKYEAKLPKVAQAENLWKELCYCHRDNGVFTPDNKFIELENLEKYLFN